MACRMHTPKQSHWADRSTALDCPRRRWGQSWKTLLALSHTRCVILAYIKRLEQILNSACFSKFGFYSILPLTAPAIVSTPTDEPKPASIITSGDPCELTIGDYNVRTPLLSPQLLAFFAHYIPTQLQVENMSPRSHHITKVASHIADYLHTPDIMFVQEIQADSSGVTSANKTLAALAGAIKRASGVQYEYVDVEPEYNLDGGKPGSNIRVAYL